MKPAVGTATDNAVRDGQAPTAPAGPVPTPVPRSESDNRQLRVLYIATAYPRHEQDIITPWLVETVDRLRASGMDVTVFTSSYRALGDQVFHEARVIRFRYFPRRWETLTHDETAVDRVKKGLLNRLKAPSYVLGGAWRIWNLCRRERFDVIHVHWPLPHSVLGWIASRMCGAPTVISFHGAGLMWVRHGVRWLRPFLKWAIRNADVVTANSTHTVRAIQEIHNRAVQIIPFGAAVGSFPSTHKTTRNRTKQILFVGRLVERKGIPYLIEATNQLSQDMDVELHIVGSGPEEAALRREIEQKKLSGTVSLHGQVSASDLHRRYSEADVFVLPAVYDSKGDTEGLGVVLIEAMSYRLPVVASGIGGIVDLVTDGVTGLRSPTANSTALASVLRRVLTDEELARRLAEGGFRHVEQNYSWPTIITRLRNLYFEILHGGDSAARDYP